MVCACDPGRGAVVSIAVSRSFVVAIVIIIVQWLALHAL
jgi:hypothetical protein